MQGPDQPTFNLVADADELPRAVEQAAYFFVLEAATNVIRHAGASHATVIVHRRQDSLLVRVEDDGVGLPSPYVSGVGLTSMRRRVQALNGSFEVRPGPTGGTIATTEIPVPK